MPLSPFTPERAIIAHLANNGSYTRAALIALGVAGDAIYKRVDGLNPTTWPHVVISKQHRHTRGGAGRGPRQSHDLFTICAAIRTDKLGAGQAPGALLEPLAIAIQKDIAAFEFSEVSSGKVYKPRISNHAYERSYPVSGAATGATVFLHELGVEAFFVSTSFSPCPTKLPKA